MEMDEIIRALANPVRRQILQWLKDPERNFPPHQGPCPLADGVCVGHIQAKAALSQSTVSAYLAMLQRAGLVSSKRIGQWTFYRRDEATIREFLDCLKKQV
jgi:ArsR family transcriptional regulator